MTRNRFLGASFFVAAMSLVGLPPLSGFFGKLVLIREGWDLQWWLCVIALLTGALTLLSMLKIWTMGFWLPPGPKPAAWAEEPGRLRGAYFGISLLVATALFVGFAAEPIYNIAFHAGEQLTDPTAYIKAFDPHGLIAARGSG